MNLYEYAVVYVPTAKEREKGVKPEVIVQQTALLAKDEGHARLLAGRAIPEEWAKRLEELEIYVRPF